jgi:HlyD family secretion protein
MASRKTRIVVGIAAVVVLGAIVGFNVTSESRDRVTVQVDKAARKDLVSIVSASGEVKPKRYADLSANVSGRITRLFVKEGDAVKQGQVVAQIDSTRYQAGLAQSEAALQAGRADLERAKADVQLAHLDLDRQKKMHDDKLISDQAYDQSATELKMKQAAVDAQARRVSQLEAAVASNRDDLEKTTVVSPMDGNVTSLQKEEGEMVIGAQSFQPTVIMTIGDLSVMVAEIMIDETDIRNLSLGQDATVKVDALENVEIKGKVTEIGASAIPRGSTTGSVSAGGTASNQAKDFKIEITMQDPPSALRPGLNCTADIVTATRTAVLAVPIQAVVVRTVDAQGKVIEPVTAKPGEESQSGLASRPHGEEKEGVFLVKDGSAVFTPVKTGIIGETDIEILGGLEAGQEIVSGSYKTLRTLKNEAHVKAEEKEKEKA